MTLYRAFLVLTAFQVWFRPALAQESGINSEIPNSDNNEIANVSRMAIPEQVAFSVYPNPAHSVIYLRLPVLKLVESRLMLINSENEVILKETIDPADRSLMVLLPENIQAGKYEVCIQNGPTISRSGLTICR